MSLTPLLGEHGATWVYGAQKGADEAALSELEAGMAHYSQLLTQNPRIRRQRAARRRGRGRYGGCAYRLYRRHAGVRALTWCWSCLTPTAIFADAALTIVGEGWLDRQSAFGKAPVGVAGKAARHGVPVCGPLRRA
ncbi:glycerate kinase [Klebsiella pneumoniae subsp. ozaenae]|uniref:Glycerate kinase n=1 Tax=Klebsiella pneumoniae subsp. ozaenae TaxID=574 RepID=A0A378B1S5_KLEPO|nr:glycerate kinase [Klebsiella pneumoniae subsp. ozaenae]